MLSMLGNARPRVVRREKARARLLDGLGWLGGGGEGGEGQRLLDTYSRLISPSLSSALPTNVICFPDTNA